MEKNKRQEVALFKYSLIAPLIIETFTQKKAKEYLEDICSREYETPQGVKRQFSPVTIKEWLRLYRRYGIDSLYPKERNDKGTLRKLSSEAKKFIVTSKITSPKRSAKSIHEELIAQGYIKFDEVSLSTIQRYLSKENLTLKKLEPTDRRAFEFEHPNDCWQSDVSMGPYLNINNKKYGTHIIAILDDSSRLILHAEAFYDEKLVSLISVFKNAVAKRGVPKKLFVDNGKIYRSSQMQLICASMGTVLSFARPYSPQSKGKIERWFRTLHDQWMNIIDFNGFNSLAGINESLSTYVEKYNNQVHSALGKSPIDKFFGSIKNLKFISNKEELDYIFLYRVDRKVKNDSTISINKKIFEVPMKYIGDKIEIRYQYDSLDKAYIFSNKGEILETIYPVNKIDNSKVIRNQNVKPIDFSPFSTN